MTREGNDKRFKDKNKPASSTLGKKTPNQKPNQVPLILKPPTESVFGFLNILRKNNKKRKADKAKEKKKRKKKAMMRDSNSPEPFTGRK